MNESLTTPERMEWSEAGLRPRTRRSWSRKFFEAFRGIKRGIRGQSSFFVHFFIASIALLMSLMCQLSFVELAVILLVIGFVLVSELFNSSIETLFHGLDESTRSKFNPCLEIASGAVLMACIFAVLIGLVIFLPHIYAGLLVILNAGK
jgi:diacylglycerol kinase